jgi:hypothetical protein
MRFLYPLRCYEFPIAASDHECASDRTAFTPSLHMSCDLGRQLDIVLIQRS